ncbi:MAG: hypothetical protein V1944_02090 [Candidatus Aenigmatarchaeota archaeon]
MPKRKRKQEDMTDEEWRNWGENFGKRMGKRGKDFGEEMSQMGERIGRRVKQKTKEKGMRNWWFETLGFIGPLISSVFGLACLAIGIWFLNFVNLGVGSTFISSLSNFLFRNIHWFFGVFLFFNYSEYFSKIYDDFWWIVSPFTAGVGMVVFILISVVILNLINASAKIALISSFSNWLVANLVGIFVLVVVVGYIIVFIKKLIRMAAGI